MIKEQIITTAFDLFSQYGIKRVSMDDIARNLSVSKRTLYEYFDDKETLLVCGLEYTHMRLVAFLEELEKGKYTVIDIILLFYEELMKRPRWYSQKFYEDLKKYPKAMQRKEVEKDNFTHKCMHLFNRGVEEGVFQKEVNFEIVALLAKEQVKMVQPSKSFCNHSNAEVYNTVLIAFLRGICTEKGRQILDRWIRTKRIQSVSFEKN
ncbi:TetR/AcrR family transcriptional regulator [Parabacteroides sp. 52]|uniref:TetR/AcrR family transcriptional regulator n=1 Tax=unclassified Parabacteroides TaxID=2649774 RepID=UPI0013D7BF78|nr:MULTISPECIES: TetR/AcrR family transcriptional regulator [unclassified Parabacteroides]MDH6533639.1 AcrR family transcriptional regulator [Parabacteroides sp. PM5-20]NDV54391.1 TetR/AcrR family transcriptional regulator [Parabacteroides sp. 52]